MRTTSVSYLIEMGTNIEMLDTTFVGQDTTSTVHFLLDQKGLPLESLGC